MATWELGRNFRVYDAAETGAYGVAEVLASTDAIRHTGGSLKHNPFNYQNAPTRYRSATLTERRVRRETAEATLRGELWPSGTINTFSDMNGLFADVIGSYSNVALATTTTAAAATTTEFTLTSAAGLAVGGALLINATTGGRQVRAITALAGAVVTVAPPLTNAPTAGDSVKSCQVFIPATLNTPVAHNFAAYGIARKYEVRGWVLDKLTLEFDSNGEIAWEISGMAKTRLKGASVQTEPVAFTTAGTAIPSGLIGSLRLGTTAEEFVKAKLELVNGHALQNNAYGTSQPQGAYRKSQFRGARFMLTQQASDDVTVFDASEAGTTQAGLLQTGLTEGQIIAIYFPTWQIDEPPGHDLGGTEEYQEEFSGQLLGTSAGNDEFKLILA